MAVAESRRHQTEPPVSTGGLALVAVTAVLKHLLENGLARRGVASQLGGDATISALPPDRIAASGDEKAQLNLFLYLVTPHTALRLDDGAARVPALAFDLHYLLTAYGGQDYQAELLLGQAIQILHESPVLERDAIGDIITALSSKADRRVVSAPLAALSSSEVLAQLQRMRIVPAFLSADDLSKLWSAMQAKLRLSATYKVEAVPMTSTQPTRPDGRGRA